MMKRAINRSRRAPSATLLLIRSRAPSRCSCQVFNQAACHERGGLRVRAISASGRLNFSTLGGFGRLIGRIDSILPLATRAPAQVAERRKTPPAGEGDFPAISNSPLLSVIAFAAYGNSSARSVRIERFSFTSAMAASGSAEPRVSDALVHA